MVYSSSVYYIIVYILLYKTPVGANQGIFNKQMLPYPLQVQLLILTFSLLSIFRFKELLIMVDTCQAATLFSQVCFTVCTSSCNIHVGPLQLISHYYKF